MSMLTRGENEKAIADYTVAIRLAPNDADPYIGRARAYTALGQAKKAAADTKKYQELTP